MDETHKNPTQPLKEGCRSEIRLSQIDNTDEVLLTKEKEGAIILLN
jgi:hypothetical protein